MTADPVEQIANAILYEGYILYPYRASAVKNRQRFNFGALYPTAHRDSQTGADTDTFEIECLVTGEASTTIDVRVRFLHLQSREVFRLVAAADAIDGAAAAPRYEPVDALAVVDHVHQTWQEAVERAFVVADVTLADLVVRPAAESFSLSASKLSEPIVDRAGTIVGRIVRRQEQITGTVTLWAKELASGLFKLRVVINNSTPLAAAALISRDEVLLSTLISTHAILRASGSEFVSLLEPPEALRSAAADCRNVGVWPVLAGRPGERDRMLASPIILYDYPQVAPESSGDWCDGAEIDEMLVLRVMTLTGDEKQAMRDVDRRARAILERTESLSEDQMLKLHGAFRGLERGAESRSGREAAP